MSCCTSSTEMFAGDDLRYRVEVRDQNNLLVDITDAAEIRFVIVRTIGGTPILSKSLTGGGVVIDGSSKFYADIAPSDTTGEKGVYHVEADIDTAGGDTYTILDGQLRIKPVHLG